MEGEMGSMGSSKVVPCVQEMAKEPLLTIPPRYLRPHEDTSTTTDTTVAIPLIDMESLLYGDPNVMDMELNKLDSSCREWGFFQLINHGVETSLLERMKIETKELFKLPMEEKKKLWQKVGDLEGFGQAFVVSEEQKLNWGDLFFLRILPKYLRNPHLFPKLPPALRDTLEVYAEKMKDLVGKILTIMAKALKMKEDEMKELFEEGIQSIRMNYYPPCPQPEFVMGLNSHSDAVTLTILLQVNEIDGLQVMKNNMWVPVKPLPDAFIVNVGDILEMATNGTYCSSVHRAIVNPTKERLSIAIFNVPRIDGVIGPAPSLITPQFPALFKRITVSNYLKGLFSRELIGKSYVDAMRIQNQET